MPDPARLPWRVPAALAGTQLIHWGSLYYAFAVLLPGMAAELGVPPAGLVGAFSVALLAQGAMAPLAGWLIDRVGARRVMGVGSLLAGAGLWLAGQVQTPGELYAAWLAIGAVMALTLYEAAFAAVTAAFGAAAARRGISAVTLVGGLASSLAWPLVAWLAATLGWREALGLLALANAACALPHALCLPGAQVAAGPAGRSGAGMGEAPATVLRQPRFRWLAAALLLVALLSATMAVHLVSMLQAGGWTPAAALAVAALFGPMQVAGRLLELAVARRAPLRVIGLVALLGLAAALTGLALAPGRAGAVAAVMAFGMANGVMTILRGAAPAELFGSRGYGAVVGVLAAGNALAAACGPPLVAVLWARTEDPALPLLLLAGLALLALVCFRRATARPSGPGAT